MRRRLMSQLDVGGSVKVGVVTHYWLPHRGGIEVLAGEQCRRLAERGHEVHVVTSSGTGPRGVCETAIGTGSIRVERHAAWDVLGRRGVPWPIPSPALVRGWVRLAQACDVVLVHGCTYAHAPVTIEAARRAGTPTLLLQHNPHVDYPGVVDLVERMVDRTLGRACCRRASKVAAVSEFTATHVRSIAGPIAPLVIPNAVDNERFRPASAPRRAAARQTLEIAGPIVLTVRRLVPRNGVDWAIRAWVEQDLDDAATFLIVGDGLQRHELEQLARGHRVVFAGAVSDDQLVDLFAAADIFVMPTRSGEGFGLAAAEAMAAGLPVVATRGGALDEVVLDGVTGHLVATDDVVGFGRVIRSLLAEPARAAGFGLAGRARVDERFTWARSIDQLEDALAGLVGAADASSDRIQRNGRVR